VNAIFPPRLKRGDRVRVIAPARSLSIVDNETREIANNRFKALGLTVSFGKHVEESDAFHSSSVESRLEDLHDAFADKSIQGIFTVIGGYNSNQLLRYINWSLLEDNPKILCGFSDITALQNAIFAKTGMVTYSGPHYSTFGQEYHFDYTLEHVKKCLFNSEPFFIEPSKQ
jgi:muramoyltetrapeptide carboxypeptidase